MSVLNNHSDEKDFLAILIALSAPIAFSRQITYADHREAWLRKASSARFFDRQAGEMGSVNFAFSECCVCFAQNPSHP